MKGMRNLLFIFLFLGSKIFCEESKEPPFLLILHSDGGWDTSLAFENTAGRDFLADQEAKLAIIQGIYCPHLDHDNARKYCLGFPNKNFPHLQSGFGETYGQLLGSTKLIPHLNFNAPNFTQTAQGDSLYISTSELSILKNSVTQFSDAIESSINEFVNNKFTSILNSLKSSSRDFDKVKTRNRYRTSLKDRVTAITTIESNLASRTFTTSIPASSLF